MTIEATQQRDAFRDGMLGADFEVREIREETREVDFVCSTESLDSYGTIIKQDWDLSRFDKNPVVLYSHNAYDLPIGQSVKHGVEKKRLLSTVKIATKEANPKAELVWQSLLQKTLRGISVGFRPLEYHWEKASEGEGEVLVFDRNLLCELSITPLPSNADALAQMRSMSPAARAALPPKTTATDPPSQQKPATERGEPEENRMSLEAENTALKSKVEATEAETRAAKADLAETRKQLDSERTAKTAIERELDKTRTDLASANERATKAEHEVIVRDVKALVGVKLAPAEVDEHIELAKKDRALFDKLMEKRAPMREMAPAIPPEPNTETRSVPSADPDEEFDALASKKGS
jgi:HK97 family phage prohead protease